MRAFLWLGTLFLMASKCGFSHEPQVLSWNTARATDDLKVFSALPHPIGSPRIAALADYLEQELKAEGLESGRDTFIAMVPDPERLQTEASPLLSTTLSIPMRNIFATLKVGRESCAFLVASHYDSKRLPGGDGIGANDSGSSSVVLLELMRGLKALASTQALDLRCHIVAVWFDGEESYLPEWRDGQSRHPARIVDNTYGSRNLADNLKVCAGSDRKKIWCLPETWGGERVEGLILLDMVGSPALKLSSEAASTPELLELAKTLDQRMFQGQLFANSAPKSIEDDHIAFIEKGIPALDLIDFENLRTWHQPSDTFESVSISSLEKTARFTHALLETLLKP